MPVFDVLNEELPQNHFVLFGLPVDFNVDMAQLRAAYKTLLLRFHPDRFVAASAAEQNKALRQTDRINQAYAVLCSLPQRAAYLLQCQGYHVDMQANLADPEFLVHQLELREGLEQIAEKKMPESQLDGLVQQAESLQKKEREFFVACFEQLLLKQGSAEEPATLQKAYNSMLKLRFIEKLFEEIDVLRHSLLD